MGSPRSNARELALHLIYAQGFTGDEPAQLLEQRIADPYFASLSAEDELYQQLPDQAQLCYLSDVTGGVAQHQEELNGIIRQYAIGWDLGRISRLALCTMQLAIYETLYVEDVPAGVAIDQAVRLAKKYDGDDTGAFVNGILGSFARALAGEAAL